MSNLAPFRPSILLRSTLMAGTCLLAAAFAAAEAQESPTAPYVNTPGKLARWQVQFRSLNANPEPESAQQEQTQLSPEVKEVLFSRTGDLTRVQTRWSNGGVTESWLAQGYAMELPPGYPLILVTPPGVSRGRLMNSDGYYPGLDWLDLKYFRAVIQVDGKPCFHYHHPDLELDAWIDVQTNLPVAAQDRDYRYRYTFLAPPEPGQTLPEPFQAALRDYKQAAAR